MKVVISIGGSVLVPEEVDVSYARYLGKLVNELSKKHQILIVAGGGRLARNYIEPARKFGVPEVICDLIGIEATKLNARFLAAAIGENATIDPPKDFVEALAALRAGKTVVMGGMHPGQSTDAVAALLAEYVGADMLINASNVDGIYDRDPKKHKDAKVKEKIAVEELVGMVCSYPTGAGKYALMDVLAAKIIERSKIKTIFLDGRDLENLKKAIEKKKFKGTTVTA